MAPAPSSSDMQANRSRRRQQRALWRLTAWGATAAVSLIAVALASQSRTGAQRLQLAFNGADKPSGTMRLAAAERRADQAQAETRQLAAKLRELSADRDRLNIRLASLEHNLDDITGSISRQTAAAKQTPPAAPLIEPLGMPATRTPLAAWPNPQAQTATPPAPAPAATVPAAATPASKPPVMVEVPMPPVRVAALPVSQPAPAKPEFAIDLGGALSSDLLRARWAEVKANFGPQLGGLHPLLAHDRHFGHLPYRLVLGPLPSIAAATGLCAKLAPGGPRCRPARFIGDPLAPR